MSGGAAPRRRAGHAPALPARLSLVAAVDQGEQARRLGRGATGPSSTGGARSCRRRRPTAMRDVLAGDRRPGRASAWPSIGSSLGGFYATAVAERARLPRRAPQSRRSIRRATSPAAIGETTAWHSDEPLRLPRRVRRRAARDRAAGDADRPGPLLRGHRQGRRSAVLARDERALRRRADPPDRGQRPRAERLRRPAARRCSPSSASIARR